MPIINGVGRVGIRNYVAPVSSIWNGLTHYYSGDNTANDLKGTSNGTLVNGTTYSTGKINNCFDFDGINDYISFPVNTFKPTGDFSISFWIYKKNNNTAGYMSFTEIGQPYWGNGMFGYNYNGGFAFEINGGRDIVSSFIPNDTWTHIVITHKASTNYKIYTNGVLATPVSGNYPNTVNTSVNPNFSSNNIAMAINNVGGYVGATKLDEIALFDGTELTASQVAELYNSGTGLQYAAPTPTYTTRTQAFAAATGISDTTILNALNTFDTGLISNGLDTDLEVLYPFVGGTSTTHQYNFMNPSIFQLTFNGGWIHSSTGAKPNGTNAYAQTGWIPSSRYSNGLTSGAWGTYIRQSLTSWPQFSLGSYSPGNYFGLAGNSTTSQYWRVNGEANTTPTTTSNKGMFQASRALTSTNMFVSQNSQQFELSGILANGGIPNVEVYLSSNNNGGATQFGSQEQALTYLSKGKYTQAQQSTFYNLVQTLQTSLGRQV